jgi:hypothetical protein
MLIDRCIWLVRAVPFICAKLMPPAQGIDAQPIQRPLFRLAPFMHVLRLNLRPLVSLLFVFRWKFGARPLRAPFPTARA